MITATMLARIEAEIQNVLLPRLKMRASDVEGWMLYGSRVSGGASAGSDIDVMVVTSSEDCEFYAEYHSFVRLAQGELPLELRVYSLKSAREAISSGGLPKAHAVSRAQVVLDKKGVLEGLKTLARQRLSRDVAELASSLRDENPAYLREAVRRGMADFRRMVHEGARTQGVALELRFHELLSLFVVYCERIRQAEAAQAGVAITREELDFLAAASTPQGARFFDPKKYWVPIWWAELERALSALDGNESETRLRLSLELLGQAFERLFQESLFEPAQRSLPKVTWVLRDEREARRAEISVS